ncbi:MAG: hypothetical protein J6B16_05090 [Clostridia bacterium]|nr:hypothetical protein [Clostridia bacterium]
MPTKKGAGGRQQNYDSRGRYTKTDYAKLYYTPPSRKEKTQKRKDSKREELFNRARNSKDKYLFEVFCEIEKALPYHVQFVNETKFDPFINDIREFDIITQKCIIEVKSGSNGRKMENQFKSQKRYAEYKNKQHIVFAPNLPIMTIINFKRKGFNITNDIKMIINTIKENEL